MDQLPRFLGLIALSCFQTWLQTYHQNWCHPKCRSFLSLLCDIIPICFERVFFFGCSDPSIYPNHSTSLYSWIAFDPSPSPPFLTWLVSFLHKSFAVKSPIKHQSTSFRNRPWKVGMIQNEIPSSTILKWGCWRWTRSARIWCCKTSWCLARSEGFERETNWFGKRFQCFEPKHVWSRNLDTNVHNIPNIPQCERRFI